MKPSPKQLFTSVRRTASHAAIVQCTTTESGKLKITRISPDRGPVPSAASLSEQEFENMAAVREAVEPKLQEIAVATGMLGGDAHLCSICKQLEGRPWVLTSLRGKCSNIFLCAHCEVNINAHG